MQILSLRVVRRMGASHYYSLSMLQRDYWPEKLFDLVPAASASSLEVLISLYFGWAADFVVLLDDDKEGRKQKERYLELFGAGLRGRILTYADISSEFAGREVEDLFPDSVAIAVQKVVATDMNKVKRDKKVFARGIQEVIARKIAIPANATLERDALRLFEGVREVLSAPRNADVTESA